MKRKNVRECAYELFGVHITYKQTRFDRSGWFDVGQTVCFCSACGSPLWGLRAPYISANKTYYYWALICSECETAIEPNQLVDDQRESLYKSSAHRPRLETYSLNKKNELSGQDFSMFEKFTRFENEIRSFFVQIKPVKRNTEPYFIGDGGESWLKEIERVDLSRANRDSIERMASIFKEWSDECSLALRSIEAEKVLKEFKLTLTGDPNVSLEFIKFMTKHSNHEIINKMSNFCTKYKN